MSSLTVANNRGFTFSGYLLNVSCQSYLLAVPTRFNLVPDIRLNFSCRLRTENSTKTINQHEM